MQCHNVSRALMQSGRAFYPGVRQYSTTLADLVKREVDQEKANLDQTEIPVPAGFQLQDKSGSTMIVLKSNYEDEVITVQASIPPKMEFDTPYEQLSIAFDVLVEKKTGVMEFQCSTAEMGFDVDSLAIFDEKEKKIAKEESAEADHQRDMKYRGPALEDLEGELQESIAEFLEVRGVTEEMARYIQKYIKDRKEPAEYLRWLEGLHRTVS